MNLLNIEARPNIDDNVLCICHCAGYVEGGSEGDEDRLAYTPEPKGKSKNHSSHTHPNHKYVERYI